MIAIRQATLGDCAALARLRLDCLAREGEPPPAAEPPAAYVDAYRRFLDGALSNNTWVVWVAAEGDRIRCAAYLHLISSLPHPSRRPRRGGILHQLDLASEPPDNEPTLVLRRVIDWCRHQDLDRLHVGPGCQAAAPWLCKAGFEPNPAILSLRLD